MPLLLSWGHIQLVVDSNETDVQTPGVTCSEEKRKDGERLVEQITFESLAKKSIFQCQVAKN